MVKLFTSRLTYSGQGKINATVKSGSGLGACLTPTWPLVAGHKLHVAQERQDPAEIERWSHDKVSGTPTIPLDEKQYTEQYLALLRGRYAEDKQPFLDILHQDKAVLTCYCGADQFCHRHLAADVLEKIAQRHAIPFERGGEIDPRTGRPWLPRDDPDRQTIQIGIASLVDKTDDAIPFGFTTAATLSQPGQNRQVLEIAHFAAGDLASAERYTDQVGNKLRAERWPLDGSAADTRQAVHWLESQAIDNRLDGQWQRLSNEQNAAWDKRDFRLFHEPGDLRLDPERQALRFGVLPILAPNGKTPLGFAATALVEQGNRRALLEVGHFANNGEDRAHQYLDNLEQDLHQRGYPLLGKTFEVEAAVTWLTMQAQQNRLPGEWSPLTDTQGQQLDEGDLILNHTFNQVHTMSGAGRNYEYG